MFNKSKLFTVSIVTMAVLIGLSSFAFAAKYEERDEITFGIVPWSESLAIGSLLEYILETDLGMKVNSFNPQVGAAYAAVKQGDMDLWVEQWLPTAHEAYYDETAPHMCDFGPMYEDAVLCWAVPGYVYEAGIHSVEDLGKPGVKEKMNGEIIGIEPGSGIMQHSEVMLQEYPELEGWELKDASDYAMMAELKRRMQRKEWTVVLLWRPHYAMARFDIECLEEPRMILGGEERVHIVGREHFMDYYPNKVTMFLSRFYLPIDKVNEIADMHDRNGDIAGKMFAEKYPELVDYWLNGVEVLLDKDK